MIEILFKNYLTLSIIAFIFETIMIEFELGYCGENIEYIMTKEDFNPEDRTFINKIKAIFGSIIICLIPFGSLIVIFLCICLIFSTPNDDIIKMFKYNHRNMNR